MARCRKCNKTGLEWIEHVGRHRLYDPTTGRFHNEVCKLTLEDVEQIREFETKSATCIHGILLDRFCPMCEDDKNKEYQ